MQVEIVVDAIPADAWAMIMYWACDGVFPVAQVGLKSHLVGCTGAQLVKLMGSRSADDAVLFIRKHYKTIQRMRRVCRSTTTASWLFSEPQLYAWLKTMWGVLAVRKSYHLDYAVWKCLDKADETNLKVISAALRAWLAQPETSVLRLRRLVLPEYPGHCGPDATITRDMVGDYVPNMPIPMATIVDAATRCAQTNDPVGSTNVNFPVVYMPRRSSDTPPEVLYLDDFRRDPNDDSHPNTGSYWLHVPTQTRHHSWSLRSRLFSLAKPLLGLRDMKRRELDELVKKQHELRKATSRLRLKLKRRCEKFPRRRRH